MRRKTQKASRVRRMMQAARARSRRARLTLAMRSMSWRSSRWMPSTCSERCIALHATTLHKPERQLLHRISCVCRRGSMRRRTQKASRVRRMMQAARPRSRRARLTLAMLSMSWGSSRWMPSTCSERCIALHATTLFKSELQILHRISCVCRRGSMRRRMQKPSRVGRKRRTTRPHKGRVRLT